MNPFQRDDNAMQTLAWHDAVALLRLAFNCARGGELQPPPPAACQIIGTDFRFVWWPRPASQGDTATAALWNYGTEFL